MSPPPIRSEDCSHVTRSPPTPAHHLAGVVVVDHDGVLRELRLAAAADQRHQVGAVQHLHLHTTHTETLLLPWVDIPANIL